MLLQTKAQSGSALIISLVVAAVVIIGGVAAYVVTDGFGSNGSDDSKQSSNTDSTGSAENQPQTASSGAAVSAMFADVVAGKYDVRCTYQDDANSGTIYYSAGSSGDVKMRFDTTSSEYNGHVLRLNDTVYTWAEGQDTGTKLTVTPAESDDKYSVDKYKADPGKYNLKCENVGTLKASVFAVPSDVTFMDVGQFTDDMTSSGGN